VVGVPEGLPVLAQRGQTSSHVAPILPERGFEVKRGLDSERGSLARDQPAPAGQTCAAAAVSGAGWTVPPGRDGRSASGAVMDGGGGLAVEGDGAHRRAARY